MLNAYFNRKILLQFLTCRIPGRTNLEEITNFQDLSSDKTYFPTLPSTDIFLHSLHYRTMLALSLQNLTMSSARLPKTSSRYKKIQACTLLTQHQSIKISLKWGKKKQKLTSEHDACNEKSLKQLITHC